MVQMWRIFGEMLDLFLLVLINVIIVAYYLSKKKNWQLQRVIVLILFIFSILGILLITVLPMISTGAEVLKFERNVNFIPLHGFYYTYFISNSSDFSNAIRNIGLNILLFVPFGLFLSWLLGTTKRKYMLLVTLFGMLLSLTVELIQFIFPTGRVADIDDLLFNTLGVFFGICIWYGLHFFTNRIEMLKREVL
jgi:glycopeptide antibiotics resistance protein